MGRSVPPIKSRAAADEWLCARVDAGATATWPNGALRDFPRLRPVRLLLRRPDGEVVGAEQMVDGVGAAAASVRDARAERGGVGVGAAAARVRATLVRRAARG